MIWRGEFHTAFNGCGQFQSSSQSISLQNLHGGSFAKAKLMRPSTLYSVLLLETVLLSTRMIRSPWWFTPMNWRWRLVPAHHISIASEEATSDVLKLLALSGLVKLYAVALSWWVFLHCSKINSWHLSGILNILLPTSWSCRRKFFQHDHGSIWSRCHRYDMFMVHHDSVWASYIIRRWSRHIVCAGLDNWYIGNTSSIH